MFQGPAVDRDRGRAVLVLVAVLAAGVGTSAGAADFYASPTGTTSTAVGTGTFANPWALQTALSQPAAVRPGDTIRLRGGTYRGKFVSYLTGTSTAPIVVRPYSGEWAKIDSGSGNPDGRDILQVNGAYTWYWGLEIMSSDLRRQSSQDGSWPTDITRGSCASTNDGQGVGVKFINIVCHDGAGGINPWKDASNAEVYGSLIYYNGWNGATSGGHGHGIYVQNIAGSKFLTDNIVFQNYSHGIHAYTEGSFIDNIEAEGNTLFLNGDIASLGSGRNLLIGGAQVAKNPVLRANALYFWPGGPESSLDLGYSAGCTNPVVVDNYVADNSYFVNCPGGVRTGNTFAGTIVGFLPSQYPGNTYVIPPVRPTGTRVLVRPNRYEAGRAHVTVFNWARQSSVAVDLSGILTPGATFEVRNAQNFFGPPVISGTYAGGSVSLPMTGLSPASPVGGTAPPVTGPDFNAFVVLTAGGGVPPPPPAAAFSFSPASPQTNAAVTFTDTSTGSPTSWQWAFGDGGSSTLRNPTHTYAVAGTYTVTLTATNGGGSSQKTQALTVAAPPVSSAPTRFFTVSPCRAVDTRNANGPTGGPALAANGVRAFPIAGACGIPASAKSVSLNVTVVGPPVQGQLRLYPGNMTPPTASAISFPAGRTRANNGKTALSTDGTGRLGVKNDASGSIHVVVDVNGYFN